jgi:arylsulfatase A-like enzyme
VWETPWPKDEWQKNLPVMAKMTTDAAIDYLRGASGDSAHPFFLFVHYACTHDPYAWDQRFDYGSSLRDRYDSALQRCDEQFGRLVSSLDARPDAARTVLVAFSDHGEMLEDHGFSYHGHSIFEPEVRILLMMRGQGIPGGGTVDAPVLLTDLYSTVLSLAGAPKDQGAGASWNLLPYARNGVRPGDLDRELLLFARLHSDGLNYDARGVLRGPYKFVRDNVTATEQLYDLRADPTETNDIGDLLPQVRAELAERVDTWSRFAAERN